MRHPWKNFFKSEAKQHKEEKEETVMQFATLILFIVAAFFACMLGAGKVGANASSGIMVIAFILAVITAIAAGGQRTA
jgi:hypothetical protein